MSYGVGNGPGGFDEAFFDASCKPQLLGPRYVIRKGEEGYPDAFMRLYNPPSSLFIVGSPGALQEGLAIVGARKATPYGISCARRFGRIAARNGIVVISGGALGCDSAAHRAALAEGAPTVVFLGGGCDQLYPARNRQLFQDVVDAGGAVVSEHPWGHPPKPYTFRARNRLIASLSKATLIVEAGFPSGTFSTADEALQANRDVLVVPGSITSKHSRGANQLLYQGAVPIVDDESFHDVLFALFGCLKIDAPNQFRPQQGLIAFQGDDEGEEGAPADEEHPVRSFKPLFDAMCAEPMNMQELYDLARKLFRQNDLHGWISKNVLEGQACGSITRFPDGRYGVAVPDLE